ncbi:glycosyltransferase [Providencia rettgeri]|uniref:glycosyltransferase n=1 Tax=Providencia rettgeri TaxID=587 RepID=UPI002361D693|nr:glycosyltransferase [Providencia rettgeri]
MNNIYLFDQFGAGGLYSGPGNYFVNLINANSESEYNFHLVHGNFNQKKISAFKSVNFIHPANGKLNNALYSFKVSNFIKNTTNIDIIQTTHSYMGSISAAKSGINKEIPTFLRIAKSQSELKNRNFLANLLNLSKKKVNILNASNGVVAISKEIEQELLSLGVHENKIFYIPNGVDTDRFNRNNKDDSFQFPFTSEYIAIAFCGALIPRKRPHLLLEAIKLLPENYVVCFIGPYDNSTYITDMQDYIKKYNLSKRVFFSGYIDDPENYLKHCTYFCLPSMNEGMPNSLLEAMASKCIPISTNISGVTDIITNNETGFIIEPNANNIADIIKNTYKHKECYAMSAYSRIINNFSASSAFKKYLSMYKGNL